MLELKDIVLDSRRSGLLQPLSLVAREGVVSAISGHGHVGKTWHLKCMMGLAPHERGYVTVDGELVTPLSSATYRRLMAYVPQDIALPRMQVSELLRRLWKLHVNTDKELHRVNVRMQWQQLGLESKLWDAFVDEIPASTMRRLLLSLTPLLDRPIVLVDMPFLGQTAEETAFVAAFLHRLASEGRVVVMTRDADEGTL